MLTKDKIAVSLEGNRAHFNKIIDRARSAKLRLKKYFLYKKALKLATRGSIGAYTSPEIEEFFISCAKKIKLNLPTICQKNSVLHVVSECYSVGGHSKVVERWIKYHAKGEKHSVYFTRMKKNKIPDVFYRNTKETGGDIYSAGHIFFDIYNALTLRRIAIKYERIVLHTHMDDIIPLLAFGSDDFPRTIILYNHADHLFWVGIRIAHLICETRSWGKRFSEEYRGITNNFVLGIPASDVSNDTLSVKPHVTSDVKIITSIGMPHKYLAIPGQFSFYDYMNSILQTRKDVIFNIIGPTEEDYPEWQQLSGKYNGRVVFLGRVIGDKYWNYINKSELIVDSFPMSGGTALGDTVILKKTTLSLKCVTGHLDYTYETDSFCHSPTELIEKTNKILNDNDYSDYLSHRISESFKNCQNLLLWQDRVEKTFQLADRYKKSRKICYTNIAWKQFTLLDEFILLFNTRERFLFSFRNWIKLSTYFDKGTRRFKIYLFKIHMNF